MDVSSTLSQGFAAQQATASNAGAIAGLKAATNAEKQLANLVQQLTSAGPQATNSGLQPLATSGSRGRNVNILV